MLCIAESLHLCGIRLVVGKSCDVCRGSGGSIGALRLDSREKCCDIDSSLRAHSVAADHYAFGPQADVAEAGLATRAARRVAGMTLELHLHAAAGANLVGLNRRLYRCRWIW